MLDPWIIEEIRRREEDRRRDSEAVVELPLPSQRSPQEKESERPAWQTPAEEGDRGVIVIPI